MFRILGHITRNLP